MENVLSTLRRGLPKQKVIDITSTLSATNLNEYIERSRQRTKWIFVAKPTPTSVCLFQHFPASIVLMPVFDTIVLSKGRRGYFISTATGPESILRTLIADFKCNDCHNKKGDGYTCIYCCSYLCPKCLKAAKDKGTPTQFLKCGCGNRLGIHSDVYADLSDDLVGIVTDQASTRWVCKEEQERFARDVQTFSEAFAEAYVRTAAGQCAFHFVRNGAEQIAHHRAITDSFWKNRLYPVQGIDLDQCVTLIEHTEQFRSYPDASYFHNAQRVLNKRDRSKKVKKFYVTVHHHLVVEGKSVMEIALYWVKVLADDRLLVGCWERCFGCGKRESPLVCKKCGMARFCSSQCREQKDEDHKRLCQNLWKTFATDRRLNPKT